MVKIFKQDEEISSKEMVQFGIDHISAGVTLIKSRPDFFDSGGYLIHIGYECILKGWWLELKGEIHSEHNLIRIAKMIPELDYESLPVEFRTTIREINKFQYLRYPDLINPIEIGDEMLQPVMDLVKFTLLRLPTNIRPKTDDEYLRKGNRILMKRPISKGATKIAQKSSL
jgi:hypothetical protein